MEQMEHAVDIFEHTHPGKVAIWLFDCSSAHEGLAPDALNINNMNVNPGGKQCHLRSTVIPSSNPPPKPGRIDTRGKLQDMVFAPDHPDPNLRGKAKGTKAVLQERESMWDELVSRCNGKVPVGKCKECSKSQAKKDAERRVAEAEAMGQEAAITEEDLAQLQEQSSDPASDWCCIFHVLSLQEDFTNEKPLLHQYVKK